MSQIEPYSYNSTYKYDMICISETYFDSSNLLKIEQFNQMGTDEGKNWKNRIYKTYTKNGWTDINYHEINDAPESVTEIVNKSKSTMTNQSRI